MSVTAYRYGHQLFVHGATWDFNPRVTRETFAEDFAKQPMIAARDLGAEPPKAQQAAMPDPDLVERLANKNRQHPLTEDGAYKEWFVADPTKDYYLHIDMARSHDAVGIGLCHFEILSAKVVVDLIHNIDPTKEWELTFERVFIFVQSLRTRGFNIKKVTFDSWQSYYMLERLINSGFQAEIYSVDKTPEAYDTLISSLTMGRIDYYFQERFVTELKHIKLYHGNRYDHEQGRSKDTSDGVAGAVTQCLKAHQGMSLTDSEVEAISHEDVLLDLQEVQVGESIYWRLHPKNIAPVDKNRKRVVRIEYSDEDLMMVMGWHDPNNKRLYVEEFLIWENFDNVTGYNYLTSFIDALGMQVMVSAYSVNEMMPLEVLGYLKNTGRNVSSPMSTRTARRSTRRVSGSTHVNDTILRQLVAQIKQGNLSIPREPYLMRDLKEMTYSNQKDRRFACALASWMDFAAREITYGHTGNTMPKAIMSSPAPILGAGNSNQQRAGSQPMNPSMVPRAIRSGSEVDGIRGKYSSMNETAIRSNNEQKQGPKSLPRSTSLRGNR